MQRLARFRNLALLVGLGASFLLPFIGFAMFRYRGLDLVRATFFDPAAVPQSLAAAKRYNMSGLVNELAPELILAYTGVAIALLVSFIGVLLARPQRRVAWGMGLVALVPNVAFLAALPEGAGGQIQYGFDVYLLLALALVVLNLPLLRRGVFRGALFGLAVAFLVFWAVVGASPWTLLR